MSKAPAGGTTALGDARQRHNLSEAVAAATLALAGRPAGLVSDLDGTLSPIAQTPEEAFILPDCRKALRKLAGRLDLVAIVSGRSAEDVWQRVGLRRIVYIGNHGLDRWEGGRQKGRAAARSWRAGLTTAMAALRKELTGVPGVRIEDKAVSFSIHYRTTPNHEAARAAVLAAAGRVAAPYRLSIREGKKVVEIGPPTWAGKAEAVAGLVRDNDLRSLVYVGDDVSDVAVLESLPALRAEGIQAVGVAVTSAEVPQELIDAADYILAGTDQASLFLEGLARGVPASRNGASRRAAAQQAVEKGG